MEAYNSALDQSLYEAVSSAKSSVSTSSGLSTNSQTALLHKKQNHGKKSKRRPHSAVVISHLSHPDPSKLETLATFPPLTSNTDQSSCTAKNIDSNTTNRKTTIPGKSGKTKCRKCMIFSLLIVLFVVLFALVTSIVLLVQLPSFSSTSSSELSTQFSSLIDQNLNQVRHINLQTVL